jgi:ABC-type polysaccharide/polyol phosphate export permease
MAMDSVLGNAQLIKKVYIPKYIFPLEKVLFSFVNTAFSLISLVLVLAVTRSPLTWWALLLWVPLLLLFVFNLGVGLILSAAVVFFRDIKHLYSVLVLALTYMTPIFYPEAILQSFAPAVFLIRLNPIYWYVAMFRQLVVYGRPPTPWQWTATVGCAVLALGAGLLFFRKKQDDFILYI